MDDLLNDFEDRVYDVPAVFTLAAGQYLADQTQELRNSDAEWFLTGMTSTQTDGGGYPMIRIKDYTGRALATLPQLLSNAAARGQQTPMGSNTYLKWPKNGALRFDLLENGGADTATVHILFRGFKRFRRGEAPCR